MTRLIIAVVVLLIAAQVALSYGHVEISNAIYSILNVAKGIAVQVLRVVADWLNGV